MDVDADADADVPMAEVVFRLDPGLTARTAWGTIDQLSTHMELPADGTLTVWIREEDGEEHQCSITVPTTYGEVRIQRGGKCSQGH